MDNESVVTETEPTLWERVKPYWPLSIGAFGGGYLGWKLGNRDLSSFADIEMTNELATKMRKVENYRLAGGAFGIATLITCSTFGIGLLYYKRKWGVHSVDEFTARWKKETQDYADKLDDKYGNTLQRVDTKIRSVLDWQGFASWSENKVQDVSTSLDLDVKGPSAEDMERVAALFEREFSEDQEPVVSRPKSTDI